MNIFNKDFRLSLDVKDPKSNFNFSNSQPEDIEAIINKGKPDFPDQVLYLAFGAINDPVATIYGIMTHPGVGKLAMTVSLLFGDYQELEDFRKALDSKFYPEPAAGGVPWFEETNEVLLIFRRGKWDIAKGKLEKGESPEQNALREVAEETGLTSHSLGKQLSSTYHIYFRNRRWTRKVTHWYMMPVKRKEKLMPQTEEDITKAKWFKIDKLRKKAPDTYPLIAEVICEVLAQ